MLPKKKKKDKSTLWPAGKCGANHVCQTTSDSFSFQTLAMARYNFSLFSFYSLVFCFSELLIQTVSARPPRHAAAPRRSVGRSPATGGRCAGRTSWISLSSPHAFSHFSSKSASCAESRWKQFCSTSWCSVATNRAGEAEQTTEVMKESLETSGRVGIPKRSASHHQLRSLQNAFPSRAFCPLYTSR